MGEKYLKMFYELFYEKLIPWLNSNVFFLLCADEFSTCQDEEQTNIFQRDSSTTCSTQQLEKSSQ